MSLTKIRSNTQINWVGNTVESVDNVLDIGSVLIKSSAAPTKDYHLATKGYVDSVAAGLDVKLSVRAKTIGTPSWASTSYTNTAGGATATIQSTTAIDLKILLDNDGVTYVTPVVGDRILVSHGPNSVSPGIYTITSYSSTAFVMQRTSDFNSSTNVTPGAFVFVEEGVLYADSGWVLTTDGAVTIGTTTLDFVQYSGAGLINPGDGMTKSGNTLNVGGTAGRIVANANSIDLATVTDSGTGSFLKFSKDTYGRVIGTTAVIGDDINSAYGSQTANTVLAAPNGSAGNPTFRALVAADIPNIDAAKITTGTLGGARGGTGVDNGTKTITLGGNILTGGAFTISGAFATTLTVTGATTVTLPTTGVLATLAGSETLTNKTINLTNNTLSGTVAQFNAALSDDDFATLANSVTLTNKTLTDPIITNIKAAAATTADLWDEITTGTIAIGAGITTGTINIGGANQSPDQTKHINIGLGGGAGSDTIVDIGTNTRTSLGYVRLNGQVRLPDVGTSGFVKLSTDGVLINDTTTYLSSVKVLKTDNTAAQSTSSSEAISGSGTINLHKIAKTGTFGDLINYPGVLYTGVVLNYVSGTQASLTITGSTITNLAVYVNGIRMRYGTSYDYAFTYTSNVLTINFTSSILIDGDFIIVDYLLK